MSQLQLRVSRYTVQLSKGPSRTKIRSFEKGLAVRGGCREEILPLPEIEASFLYLFSYAPLIGEKGRITGDFFGLFLGVCLLPTPSRQPLFETSDIRSFEKGLADRGGWREETLQRPEIEASFLYPFSYAPLGEWGQISGDFFGLFLGVCLLPTPSRQPLFETSDDKNTTESESRYGEKIRYGSREKRQKIGNAKSAQSFLA